MNNKIKLLSLIILFIVGCSFPTEPEIYDLNLTLNLEQDSNDYYHLLLDQMHWQTFYRITGTMYYNNFYKSGVKINWASDHFWILGDTLGYIVSRGLSDDLVYVNYDTNFVTWFNNFKVPIINSASYSGENGEVNQMFAPVKSMVGDTITIWFWYELDNLDSIKIILY